LCKHCFFSKELNNNFEKDLSLEEIDKFSKELGKLVWLSFSGGEPFLREDLFEVYRIFIENNRVENVSIPTNGTLPEKTYSEVLKMLEYDKVKSLTINISMEGPRAIHNEIRGINCYDRAIETYNRLAELKERFPKLSIMVSTVITNKNYRILEDFNEEIRRIMPKIDFHNFEIMRGDPKDKSYNAPNTKELKEIMPIIFKIWKQYDYYKSRLQAKIADNTKKILYNKYIDIMETKKQPWRCYAGLVHAVIDYRGDVFFCEMLPKIGNLREKTFSEIWSSNEAKKMRESIKNRERSCTHSCFQITNLIFNQFYWPKLISS
jgi:MoaA/NifB/PqqE/SkfB family radical SAM enzyme